MSYSKAEVAAWNWVQAFKFHDEVKETHERMLANLSEIEWATEAIRRACVIDWVRSGASWQTVGDAIGLTRQGAMARYARYV